MGCVASTSSSLTAVGPAPAVVRVAAEHGELSAENSQRRLSKRKLTMRHTSSLSTQTAQSLQMLILDMARTGKLELTSTVERDDSGQPKGTLARQGVPTLKQIPGVVFTMTNLTELNLCCNQIYEVPREIVALKGLHVLILSENQLVDLPAEITFLSSLRVLEIAENYIGALPDDIGRLSNLEILRANRNRLATLPDGLAGCERLKLLNLYNNNLEALGTGLSALSELEELNLSNNALVALPEVGRWKNLKRLYLQMNLLEALPDMSALCNLELFQAHRNRLSALPDMDNLVNLRKIDVNTNQISEIPRSFELMAQLEHLSMRKNSLMTLPPHLLSRCRALEIIDLGSNPITPPVPGDLGSLPNLKTLLLDGCSITKLPIELIGLRQLCRANFGSCLQMDDQETFEVVMELKSTCARNGGWLKTG